MKGGSVDTSKRKSSSEQRLMSVVDSQKHGAEDHTERAEREAGTELAGTVAWCHAGRCRAVRREVACTVDGNGELFEGVEAARAGLVRVDGEHHALSTVASLTAVEPHRRGAVDGEIVGREHGSVSGNSHEARVDAGRRAGELQLAARVCERGLRRGVVLGVELEDNGVTGLGGHTRRSVRETVRADLDQDDATLKGVRGRVGRVRVRCVGRRPGRGAYDNGGRDGRLCRCRRDGDARVRGGVRESRVWRRSGGSSRGRGTGRGGTLGNRGVLEVGEAVWCAVGPTVYSKHHSSVAVGTRALGAVDPNGFGVLYGDVRGGEAARNASINRHITAVEPAIYFPTRVGKGRLDGRMVLLVELEDDHVADVCENGLRRKGQFAIGPTDDYSVCGSRAAVSLRRGKRRCDERQKNSGDGQHCRKSRQDGLSGV